MANKYMIKMKTLQKIGYALPVTLITPVAVPLMVAVLIYQGNKSIKTMFYRNA